MWSYYRSQGLTADDDDDDEIDEDRTGGSGEMYMDDLNPDGSGQSATFPPAGATRRVGPRDSIAPRHRGPQTVDPDETSISEADITIQQEQPQRTQPQKQRVPSARR